MIRKQAIRINEAQQEYILETCGKQAADNANYGWASDGVSVCTKVYGHGYLTSQIVRGKVTTPGYTRASRQCASHFRTRLAIVGCT